MKVFVDECVTYDLMPYLKRRAVSFTHIADTHFRSLKNGVLLRQVQTDFDVFLTTDRHIKNQQKLSSFALAFVVLRGTSNDVSDLTPLLPDTFATFDRIRTGGYQPGDLYEIYP